VERLFYCLNLFIFQFINIELPVEKLKKGRDEILLILFI